MNKNPNNLAMTLFLTLMMMIVPVARGLVLEEGENGGAIAETTAYRAEIAKDGCMSGLVIGGVGFIEPGVAKFTRGIYLLSDRKVIPLGDISIKDGAVLAKGGSASITYRFSDSEIVFDVDNFGDTGVNFFMVFDKAVDSLVTDAGMKHATPLGNGGLENVTFLSGENTLKLIPKVKLWPFEGRQVAQIDLKAGESRSIGITIGAAAPSNGGADTEEPPVPEAVMGDDEEATEEISIGSPMDYQVFQRTTMERGTIHVSAKVKGRPDAVEYKLTGENLPSDWTSLPFDKSSGHIEAEVETRAGGWYRFELRTLSKGEVVHSRGVERVGVGEVFIGAGQSNSTSCGQFRTKQESGMVANFTGDGWRLADDPQLGSSDEKLPGCDGGSYYPAFGDAMFEEFGVPIGITPTGHTGTSVKYWQPGGDLYKGLLKRMEALGEGGFRAVLWHQGESDMGMKKEEYHDFLKNLIKTSRKDAGWEVPWMVAQASYPDSPEDNAVRTAQAGIWEEGIAMEGPDTDRLNGSNRDKTGVHFSPEGLARHGKLWAEKVGSWIVSIRQGNGR